MGRKKTYNRDEVLERAMELFWKVGFEGAHLSMLVEATGVNRFGLYKEFDGKMGLFEEALARYLEQAAKSYESILGQHPQGLDNIRSYFKELHFSPDYHGCFMINTLIEKHVISDKAFKLARQFSKNAKALFHENVEAALNNNELKSGLDAEVFANFLLTLDQGLALYGISDPNNRAKDKMIEMTLSSFLP